MISDEAYKTLKSIYLMAVVFAGLDVLSTYIGIRLLGMEEAHPVIDKFLMTFGLLPGVIFTWALIFFSFVVLMTRIIKDEDKIKNSHGYYYTFLILGLIACLSKVMVISLNFAGIIFNLKMIM